MKRTKYPEYKNVHTRQEVFAKEWLKDFNTTRAAIAAGYSKKTAKVQGYKALQTKAVRHVVETEMERRRQRLQISQDQVVEELAKIAFSDIKDFASWNALGVLLKSSHQLESFQSGAVAEVSETSPRGGGKGDKNVRFKLYDKLKALELLGKHLGMFPDKIEVDGKVKHENEHTYHVIQELIADPTVAERVRSNFRQRVGNGASTK